MEKPAGVSVEAFLQFKASIAAGTATRTLAEATLRATEHLVLGPPVRKMNKTGAVERTAAAFAKAPGSIWTLKGQFSRTIDVLAGYFHAHFWLMQEKGLSRRSIAIAREAPPYFDRVFVTAGAAAMMLGKAVLDAEPRLFATAIGGLREAVALAGEVSMWVDGGLVALRYAELLEWAALQKKPLVTLEEAVASEDWLWRIRCCLGSLSDPIYLPRASLVAGRAVAILGGTPITLEGVHLLLGHCINGDPHGKDMPYICPVPARESLDIDGVPHSEHYAKLDDSCASSRCKVTGPDLKSCSRCKMVHYCSAACQKADWKALHKKACYSRSYTPPAPAPVQSTAETSSSEGGGAAAAAATPPPPPAAATAAAPNSSGGSALAAACAPVANLPLQHPNN